jgi:hypothetical protein
VTVRCLLVSKVNLLAQHLRACAWWRLDRAGVNAILVARSVIALLDTAAYLVYVPDDDPAISALTAAGCFSSGVFDPGPEGAMIIRGWQLSERASAGPRDLLAALVQAATCPPEPVPFKRELPVAG